jgi:hypothetical protein
MSKKYCVTRAEKSRCPDCHSVVDMLATHHVVDAPAFYLCACGYIGQLGVGPIRRGARGDDG